MEVRKVIQAATQFILNAILVVLLFIIPVLGFDLLKTIIAVLLTELFLYFNFTEEELNRLQEYARNIIAVAALIIGGYYINHRKWMRQSKERLKILKREAALAEANNLKKLKQKILEQMRKALAQKSPVPLKILAIDLMQMRNLSPLSLKNFKTELAALFEKQQDTGKSARAKKTKKRKLGGARRR